MSHSWTKMAIALAIVVFVGITLLIKSPLVSIIQVKPELKRPDTLIPEFVVTFSDLPGDPVRGKITGTLESTHDFEGKTISFCLISEGEIISNTDTAYLTCPTADVKETTITNSTFSISLFSGTYFVDIPSLTEKVSVSLPGRITVHKGKLSTVILTENLK